MICGEQIDPEEFRKMCGLGREDVMEGNWGAGRRFRRLQGKVCRKDSEEVQEGV